MDILAPISFFKELLFQGIGAFYNRPRLVINILETSTDLKRSRLVYRASVINNGRIEASHCEGFWAIFNSQGKEISAGTSVYWAPKEDNDYDFLKKDIESCSIKYNERRYCFAEIDIPKEPVAKNYYFFPYDGSIGRYSLALIIEYGKYKSFNFIYLNIAGKLSPKDSNDKIDSKIIWKWPNKFQHISSSIRFINHISKTDYHNYIRPV